MSPFPSSFRVIGLGAILAAGACMPRAVTPASPAAPPASAADLVALQRAWWQAFTLADTATLARLTAPTFRLTLSSGRTFDRAGTLAEAASHTTGGRLTLTWADEAARPLAGGSVVLLTARMGEAERLNVAHYRYSTLAERDAGGTWRVVAAQSTRELESAPRVWTAGRSADGPAADLRAYAGHYRVPSGAVIAIAVEDSALALTDPNGAILRLEPIGPDLFESTRLSASNGIVRFAFARDGAGRVTAMSRLLMNVVNSFPRVAEP